ncbi:MULTISPECIES: CsgG/HfaB family protein [Pasteurellaceae]|uniref:Curli production assembly/transport component CsgG n=1 Tax=Pasteurella atlantica TaxID=2827233 RepID=A0AAW8CMR0_9PAST|nr:CsgG/HfaB family protein [Pasteurella atlantica]MBR0573465.1 CsgG/HfaB family protein [Pasteurella atlantica]MDP8039466.1 CsgG/HfaB family protein [Pasteurella atlantica]MDP8041557.1 CsgG/HfaB family protein [Pasteurella atlantica]MDP8043694.1 CsgG/HfaB family protein [Pasteurella atlantica]MDP8045809.1 CsgG/HfaB family protein [Pasteurella atlantica]
MKKLLPIVGLSVLTLVGCATEGSRVVETQKVATYNTTYHGQKSPIALGKFNNRSSYQNGIFSDGSDRLGSQSKTILLTHLQQTGRFSVLERANLNEMAKEAKIRGKKQHLKGATYVVTGDVTEFGRKTVGDHQLFGILGRGKQQIAYAKVALNILNVNTSEVVYSSFGAGEYSLSNREIIGFGGTAGYDATLNGKVLDLAIREAVNNLVKGIETGQWTPSK